MRFITLGPSTSGLWKIQVIPGPGPLTPPKREKPREREWESAAYSLWGLAPGVGGDASSLQWLSQPLVGGKGRCPLFTQNGGRQDVEEGSRGDPITHTFSLLDIIDTLHSHGPLPRGPRSPSSLLLLVGAITTLNADLFVKYCKKKRWFVL